MDRVNERCINRRYLVTQVMQLKDFAMDSFNKKSTSTGILQFWNGIVIFFIQLSSRDIIIYIPLPTWNCALLQHYLSRTLNLVNFLYIYIYIVYIYVYIYTKLHIYITVCEYVYVPLIVMIIMMHFHYPFLLKWFCVVGRRCTFVTMCESTIFII